MKSLITSFLIANLISTVAGATEVNCGILTTDECQAAVDRANIGKVNSEKELRQEFITITGAVFARDKSIPELGVAYRDPSGLIWGEPKSGGFLYLDAKDQCQTGTRLPTMEEFQNFARYWGFYSPYNNYQPYNINENGSKSYFFNERFRDQYFWTSTRFFPKAEKSSIRVFSASSGFFSERLQDQYEEAVLCVAESK